MSSERPEEFSSQSTAKPPRPYEAGDTGDSRADRSMSSDMKSGPSQAADGQTSSDQQKPAQESPKASEENKGQATVIVRGETVRSDAKAQGKEAGAQGENKDGKDKEKDKPRKTVSEAKAAMQKRLPALQDDADAGVQKEQMVVRDGKPDLAFTGTLVASAAPAVAPKGKWQEYRIYETSGGKHVFSKVTRTIYVEDADTHEAEVFDPAPSSMPSQLLRSARDLTRSRPLTWMDAAVAFFGYDPLAKELYRKVGHQFEEHIS